VPLGLAAWFRSCGIKHATELDWWDEIRHPGSDLRLTFAPAQVFSPPRVDPVHMPAAQRGSFDCQCLVHEGCSIHACLPAYCHGIRPHVYCQSRTEKALSCRGVIC